ncbi:MAG: RNA methyltransferase [Candidatus Omnitrophica bacterium CG07_land_8_20_14_0_80_42_15]|uniref:RNA methyltransferase n=1 Tax=Candidatus Aquitaenariimonas noxiae TaxID=1974741 RepID=A0A2J0KX25_9BACT|nr:MAG: RNA methyltransferase [Candidatus Omnitrophica bacterium CG07_land_8_20_14_0_80_42_15]
MDIDKTETILITCGRGIVPYLSKEVGELGYKVESSHNTGIEISASLRDTMKLNLALRTAYHVLYLLKKFSCNNPDELYKEIASFPWEDVVAPSEYLSVISRTDTPAINNSVFASQKMKDAIVDRISEKCGSRPSSGPGKDNVVINFYWKDDKCWVYLNTSGKKLSDRGYRKIPHKAPLQETLAAALLRAARFDGSQSLVNPMCGSGTLAIEAALIALKRAPGLLRNNFGLQHMIGFDPLAWIALRKEMNARSSKKLPFRIIASDIDKKAIQAAKKNAQTAGVERMIEFYVCDFKDTPMPEEKGIVILNPEYGLRLGSAEELEKTYKSIGDFFKNKCSGFTGYIFTGNMALAKKVGLRTSRRLIFFNAKIECRLLEYEIYAGSKEKNGNAPGALEL